MVTWKMVSEAEDGEDIFVDEEAGGAQVHPGSGQGGGLPSGHRRDVPPGPGPQLAARHRLQHRCHCHHYRRVSPPILDRIPQP